MTEAESRYLEAKKKIDLEKQKLDETTRANKANEAIKRWGLISDATGKVLPGLKKVGQHLEWYNRTPELTELAGSLQWTGNPAIIPLDIWQDALDDASLGSGIFASYFIPYIGADATVSSKNTPVNRMATQVWTYLSSKLNKVTGFNPVDLSRYLICVDSIEMFYQLLNRIYGCMHTWSDVNYYLPYSLLLSQGVDYQDIKSNLSNLYAYMIEFKNRLNSFAIPAEFYLADRHMWMASNVFLDSDSSKAQMYLHQPLGFYTIPSLGSAEDIACQFIPWMTSTTVISGDDGVLPTADHLVRYADIVKIGDTLLDNLFLRESFNQISQTIAQAFSADMKVEFTVVPQDYRIEFVIDDATLTQIMNTTYLGGDLNFYESPSPAVPLSPAYFHLYYKMDTSDGTSINTVVSPNMIPLPTKNVVPGNLGTTASPSLFKADHIIINYYDNPRPDSGETMRLTRGCTAFKATTATSYKIGGSTTLNKPTNFTFYEILAAGSELYIGAKMFTRYGNKSDSSGIIWDTKVDRFSTYNDWFKLASYSTPSALNLSQTLINAVNQLNRASQFDWHPMQVSLFNLAGMAILAPADTSVFMQQYHYDFDNFTIITVEQLSLLHRTALLSLFSFGGKLDKYTRS